MQFVLASVVETVEIPFPCPRFQNRTHDEAASLPAFFTVITLMSFFLSSMFLFLAFVCPMPCFPLLFN